MRLKFKSPKQRNKEASKASKASNCGDLRTTGQEDFKSRATYMVHIKKPLFSQIAPTSASRTLSVLARCWID